MTVYLNKVSYEQEICPSNLYMIFQKSGLDCWGGKCKHFFFYFDLKCSNGSALADGMKFVNFIKILLTEIENNKDDEVFTMRV